MRIQRTRPSCGGGTGSNGLSMSTLRRPCSRRCSTLMRRSRLWPLPALRLPSRPRRSWWAASGISSRRRPRGSPARRSVRSAARHRPGRASSAACEGWWSSLSLVRTRVGGVATAPRRSTGTLKPSPSAGLVGLHHPVPDARHAASESPRAEEGTGCRRAGEPARPGAQPGQAGEPTAAVLCDVRGDRLSRDLHPRGQLRSLLVRDQEIQASFAGGGVPLATG
jgi:hypothetical protein